MMPRSVSCRSATSNQPLLAAGLAGLGCRIASTATPSMPPSFSATCARFCANLPTPMIVFTRSSRTMSHSARSQILLAALRSAAHSSGGVRFRPVLLRKINGHRLCTKHCRKKTSAVPHNFRKRLQNLSPLTCKLSPSITIVIGVRCDKIEPRANFAAAKWTRKR